MNVMPKSRIVSAYIRAREHLEHGEACAAAAQALGVEVALVESVVVEAAAQVGEELA